MNHMKMRVFQNRANANVTASELDVRASESMAFAECSFIPHVQKTLAPKFACAMLAALGGRSRSRSLLQTFPAMMNGTLL